jgi:hypothetical protein
VIELYDFNFFLCFVEDIDQGRCIIVYFTNEVIINIAVFLLVDDSCSFDRTEIIEFVEVSSSLLIRYSVCYQRLKTTWLRIQDEEMEVISLILICYNDQKIILCLWMLYRTFECKSSD